MLHTLLRPTNKQWFFFRIIVITALLWVVRVHGQKPLGNEAGPQDPRAAPDKKNTQNLPAPKPSSAKNGPDAEVTVQDSGTTFKLRVNRVQVHVVVRDTKGNPVGNLKQEDFELYDQGKLQPLSLFTVETRETRRVKAEAAALTQSSEMVLANNSNTVLPDRFIALYFDDSHLSLEDARYARTGIAKFLDTLAPTDRVGLFTSSGQLTLAFTNDKAAVEHVLDGLVPRPKYVPQFRECPDISHYEADQIINVMNQQVFDVVVEETVQCRYDGDRNRIGDARQVVRMMAPKILTQGDTENEWRMPRTRN